MKPGLTINYGIQECAKCKYFLRCEECAYNEKDINKLIAEARKEMAKEIYQHLYNLYKAERARGGRVLTLGRKDIEVFAQEDGVEVE